MIRGDQVYRDIQGKIGEASNRADRLGEQLRQLTDELDQLRTADARTLAELSRTRLDELRADRVIAGFDAADHRVLELLRQKEDERKRLQEAISESEARTRELESAREHRVRARDSAMAEHDQQVEATRARIEATEDYAFQANRSERAADQANHAGEKAAQAESDREAKGRPYEQDRLFSYLWRRRYRFPEYRANHLTRALDGWVAGLCGYESSHRDYMMLCEIPVRLRAHADRLAAAADEEAEALLHIEREALAADGVPALAAVLEETVGALAEVEARIDAEEQDVARLRDEQAALQSGRDHYTAEALSALRAQLEGEDVATLAADAYRTGGGDDDRLVARIGDLRDRSDDLERRIEAAREEHEHALTNLRDLEELRRRFRRSGYDSSESVFRDGFDTGGIMSMVLRGALAVGDAWLRMKSDQSFRRRRSSSNGGGIFGRSSSPGRGGGFGIGGGFRSGGGFGGGGGGFRTGGGF